MDNRETVLYFIAILPPDNLRQSVKILKEEMKLRFNAKHALKSPAHITLQMPFKWSFKEEKMLLIALKKFAFQEKAFTVGLNGFNCFTPRVIFVKVIDHSAIAALHTRLSLVLIEQLGFENSSINPKMHPHMTIATRDLKKNAFHLAWREFEDREFIGSFLANGIGLLKHNGKQWEIYQEFPFGS